MVLKLFWIRCVCVRACVRACVRVCVCVIRAEFDHVYLLTTLVYLLKLLYVNSCVVYYYDYNLISSGSDKFCSFDKQNYRKPYNTSYFYFGLSLLMN